MSKALCCPTCRTPLEWSRKERRYLHCHPSPEATTLIRQGARNRRAGRRWNQNTGDIRTAPTEKRAEAMPRTLTLKCERRVEDAAEDIRIWANDMIDSLYANGGRDPIWWSTQLFGLAQAYGDAALAYDEAPKSGPNAEQAG